MKKSTYRLFFVILTASWLCGCSVKSDDPGIVVDIPKTFYVDLFEQLDTLPMKNTLSGKRSAWITPMGSPSGQFRER